MEDAHSGTVTGRFEGSKGIVCRYPQGGKKLAGALVEKSGGGGSSVKPLVVFLVSPDG